MRGAGGEPIRSLARTAVVAVVRPGIDRDWLTRVAAQDPFTHAFAVWDLARYPDRTSFLSCTEGSETTGYLLVWHGDPARPVVHWVGDADRSRPLGDHLPPPPFIAVVPEGAAATLLHSSGDAVGAPILGEVAARATPVPPATFPGVRRLRVEDRRKLAAWAELQIDPIVRGYSTLDPARDIAWAAFEAGEPVGVAYRLAEGPGLWLLGAIYVDPAHRRRGVGYALTATAVGDARHAGADAGLWVREENVTARHVYERLGFRRVQRKWWVEVGPGARRASPQHL